MSYFSALVQGRAFSLQVFPPKTQVGLDALCASGGVLEQLYTLGPDMLACTYEASCAGGNLEVLQKLTGDGKTAMTHFGSRGNSGMVRQLENYRRMGVSCLLAEDLSAAALGRELGFTVGALGDPEGFSLGTAEEGRLKAARDAGAEFVLAEGGWEAVRVLRWRDAMAKAGLLLPAAVRILPAADLSRVAAAPGLPEPLQALAEKYWIYPNPFGRDDFDASADRKRRDFREAGIEYTLRQMEQLRQGGMENVHLVTGNGFADAARIAAEAGLGR